MKSSTSKRAAPQPNLLHEAALENTCDTARDANAASQQSPARGADEHDLPRRGFMCASALAATGAAILPASLVAAQAKPSAEEAPRKKTFLVVEGHLDDSAIGAGGVLIQAARSGHRVVVVTVAGDYSTWAGTKGREEKTKRDLIELSEKFAFEKRFLNRAYHQTSGDDLELKRELAEIYVELKPDVAFISHYEDHWPDHSGSGIAAKDAFLFSHGLSHDMRQYRIPLIFAFNVSPVQTYHFEPDVFYDVSDVMHEYMDLIARVEAIRTGRPLEQEIKYEFRTLARGGKTLPLSAHGVVRLAEALGWGNQTGCQFAIGFRTVWGQRRGPSLF